MSVVQGQTNLTLVVQTFSDLTSAASVLVKFRSPSGDIYSVNGTITNRTSGTVSAKLPAVTPIFGTAGVWKCWAHVTFNDASVSIGQPQTIKVVAEGA